jgi:hypothetical protein
MQPFLEDAPQLLRLFPEAEVVVNVSCIAATLIAALLLAALGTVLCSSQLHRCISQRHSHTCIVKASHRDIAGCQYVII